MTDLTEQFKVCNRFTGDVQFTAKIVCAPDATRSARLGLAVRWALKTGANLAGANLAFADLAGANLARAYLTRADLTGASLTGANLAGANLAGANLTGANLAGANLAGANLAGADLTGASLTGANLARANLARADLAGADLARADLAGANLAGANLAGAKIKSLFAIVHRINNPYVFHAYDTDNGIRIVAGCRNFSPAEYRAHVAANYADTPRAHETLAILDFIEARAAFLNISEAAQ